MERVLESLRRPVRVVSTIDRSNRILETYRSYEKRNANRKPRRSHGATFNVSVAFFTAERGTGARVKKRARVISRNMTDDKNIIQGRAS